ncbi:hypothetical protein ACJMK2_032117 [Sinanodonta woodiana]|uniref:Uncharacterized protein n=1 Tax=Sinanodonta woodiana TaxID=1069815 RepID=A0ABD3X4S3_SINWO
METRGTVYNRKTWILHVRMSHPGYENQRNCLQQKDAALAYQNATPGYGNQRNCLQQKDMDLACQNVTPRIWKPEELSTTERHGSCMSECHTQDMETRGTVYNRKTWILHVRMPHPGYGNQRNCI